MESTESALVEFFSECDEILQRFSSKLSKVEKEGVADADSISALYRDMHTLKGSSQLFGFRLVAQIAHAMEASLEPIRRLKLQIPVPLIDALFLSIDLIERIVKKSNSSKSEVSGEFDNEAEKVVPLLLSAASEHFGGEIYPTNDKISDLCEVRSIVDAPLLKPEQKQKQEQPQDHGVHLMPTESKKPLEVTPVVQPVAAAKPAEETPRTEGHDATEASSTVRINVSLLDKLMNLVGEMVLVRNQMLQYSQRHDALEFLTLSQRLDVVTSELQADVMKTRMQPIGSILSKFQRLIRDLAKDLGKQIELSLHGAETELDKTLLEAIKDPLTHIIRNSCDHGLETAADRIAAKKSAVGHINVRAFHEGGHVIIEIIDDGRGLDLKRILEKSIDKKIITQEQATKLVDREIANLIFAPGFSTAEKVTSVSGRGVGMDVVKTNLERIGGHVELQSEFGRGMAVRLRIPLTLAIVPALIVRAGGEQFAIPQVKLAELVRVEKDGPGQKIEFLQGRPVFRLRGHLLPIIDLREVLSLSSVASAQAQADCVNIVVLNGEGEAFGLIVDEIKDTADIVVKPLSHFLKKLQIFSGATIMGDGSVSLILDVAGLAQKTHLFQRANRRDFIAENSGKQKAEQAKQDVQDFLFFKLNSVESYCLPLCLVHRLEEFAAADVQRSGSQRMVKYRGSILPIVSLNEFFSLSQKDKNASSSSGDDRPVSLIVVQRKARLYGIEVNEVIDIASATASIEDSIKEIKGILGSLIVDKNVATVIDIFTILDLVAGGEGASQAVASVSKKASKTPAAKNAHILFAEDTVFFVRQVRQLLEKNGYVVTHAADGELAWDILSASKPGDFQLVLSDIEMPKMTGFELAQKIRGDSRFTQTPLIALTTRVRDVDLERGREVGFTRYLEKLRSDELLEVLGEILGGKANV